MRTTYETVVGISEVSRSQWPSGLRHGLARTLGSWARTPLKGMDICVCVYSVYVVLCVGSGLATG
jgi:hypothetical protein